VSREKGLCRQLSIGINICFIEPKHFNHDRQLASSQQSSHNHFQYLLGPVDPVLAFLRSTFRDSNKIPQPNCVDTWGQRYFARVPRLRDPSSTLCTLNLLLTIYKT
jgi:hypothetical protein